jgi:organic radical activating enzyme
MNKIKLSELFYSIQGEGRYMGVPSVFLRTFGCNFRCKFFGRELKDIPSNETHNPEVTKVIADIKNYNSYNELPLVETGCDSYAAVYPEFKKFSPMVSMDKLATDMVAMLPHKEWNDEHLVITGGEPLLGWQRAYPELLDQYDMARLKALTFETNGTQPLAPELKRYLSAWAEDRGGRDSVTFSVSAKLSCSGEPRADAINPKVVCGYEEVGYTYLKFVVATEADAEEALETIDVYRAEGFAGPAYLMPVGGIEHVYALNNKRVAELAMAHGLRYSDRLQVPLFKNAWGT